MAKPTAKQIGFLNNLGIQAPPTKAACSSLITFIIEGNASYIEALSKLQRIQLIIACQKKWIGKKVTYKYNHTKHGLVKFIRAVDRNANLINRDLNRDCDYGLPIATFEAQVQWEKSHGAVFIGSLILES